MKEIPDGSVDMVLTDPPYGTTACKWDSIISLEPMWEELKRIIKPNGAIVMTASQPFTTTLITSNIKQFKYCWVWEKTKAMNFQQAKNSPLKKHEDVVVFSSGVIGHAVQTKKRMPYNPQGVTECDKFKQRKTYSDPHGYQRKNGEVKGYAQKQEGYPCSVLRYGSVHNPPHPTQKPVELMEYLIKTYTNEGETVLDFTMGSGTTGVAARNLNRSFIGIELDIDYFNIASERILGEGHDLV
jgi:site-specific DNA-methyltransferase (adenine-specific)